MAFISGLMGLFALGAISQSEGFPKLTGPYLGQKPPGATPELFAPGVISTCAQHGIRHRMNMEVHDVV